MSANLWDKVSCYNAVLMLLHEFWFCWGCTSCAVHNGLCSLMFQNPWNCSQCIVPKVSQVFLEYGVWVGSFVSFGSFWHQRVNTAHGRMHPCPLDILMSFLAPTGAFYIILVQQTAQLFEIFTHRSATVSLTIVAPNRYCMINAAQGISCNARNLYARNNQTQQSKKVVDFFSEKGTIWNW